MTLLNGWAALEVKPESFAAGMMAAQKRSIETVPYRATEACSHGNGGAVQVQARFPSYQV